MRPTRRAFLKGASAGLVGGALAPAEAQEGPPARLNLETVPVDIPTGITRTWLGPEFWANRLQDWRLHDGRIECLAAGQGNEVRTVALLTREGVGGGAPGGVACTATVLEAGRGFVGFLVGAGGGLLDYRAAALCQKASGVGGGVMAVAESDGNVRFREHTDEEKPLAYAELRAEESRPGPAHAPGDKIRLQLEVVPLGDGKFAAVLRATRPTGEPLGFARRTFEGRELVGGILLVSSGGRYAFEDVRTSGPRDRIRPERALGPVVGTLFSVSGDVLKLSAQFMPLGDAEPRTAILRYRARGDAGRSRDGPTAKLQPGYTALFRVEGWDPTREWEYTVDYPAEAERPASYRGTVPKEPSGGLVIGLVNCTIATARSLEGGPGKPDLPRAELLGRYTTKNMYFPHDVLARNLALQRPDLLVFSGDQFYEGNPTRRDGGPNPLLDYLYKWYLWVWAFRELTRNVPAILQVDDHDVYHGNVWGNGGRAAPQGDQNRGGYRCTGEFVNVVQRTQCSHDPDPYDAAPVEQGITVYYGAFTYGGVSFAILEDRKFKTAPLQGADLDVHEADLLGARQEKFLEAWAGRGEGVVAKVCLTQTVFACVQTSPAGRPLLDFDSNGYPKFGRDRAVELLAKARALVLAGDQHLATLVRHGVRGFADGVLQFTGPAAGSSWQRWFERPLPCDFTDAFGNKVRVLAAANPKVTFAEYRAVQKGRGQGLGDRGLKSEGYGIVRVDPKAREFVIECWPWNVDPSAAGARQFEGWPYRLAFDEAVGR